MSGIVSTNFDNQTNVIGASAANEPSKFAPPSVTTEAILLPTASVNISNQGTRMAVAALAPEAVEDSSKLASVVPNGAPTIDAAARAELAQIHRRYNKAKEWLTGEMDTYSEGFWRLKHQVVSFIAKNEKNSDPEIAANIEKLKGMYVKMLIAAGEYVPPIEQTPNPGGVVGAIKSTAEVVAGPARGAGIIIAPAMRTYWGTQRERHEASAGWTFLKALAFPLFYPFIQTVRLTEMAWKHYDDHQEYRGGDEVLVRVIKYIATPVAAAIGAACSLIFGLGLSLYGFAIAGIKAFNLNIGY